MPAEKRSAYGVPLAIATLLAERDLEPVAGHPTLIGTMRDRTAEAVIAAGKPA